MPGAVDSQAVTNGEAAAVTKQVNGTNGAPQAAENTDNKDALNGGDDKAEPSSGKKENAKADVKNEPKEPEKQKCEVQFYEARYDVKGERELKALDAEKAHKKDADSEDEKRKYALSSYKWYTRGGELESSSVEIMSPHIILALQKIINEYPDEHFWSDTVTMDSPYKPVFHYRDELAKYAGSLGDEEATAHVKLLLTFCEKENRRAISEYEANVRNAIDKPSIRWSNLWMVYKPGHLLFTGAPSSLRCMEIVDSWERGGNCPAYIVQGKTFTHDGTRFGYEEHELGQSPYKGMKELSKLRCVPHDYYEEREMAKKVLTTRGQKFISLKGSHYKTYSGTVSALANVRDWNHYGQFKEEPMIINSRIMVDAKWFSIMKSPNRIQLDDYKPMPKDCTPEEEHEYITERDLLLADHRLPGYALEIKRWCWFNIDLIKPVVFNTEAFASLLLPARQKSLVHSLVKTHVSGTDSFDDMIAGKGRGLVFVLHGCPGVGKTFTAESVADHIERPLYILNSGELGIQPKEVEDNLNKALMLAVAWNAILLIDEADVFLEQRSTQDLQRNCLVSLFLRTLEYYEGILFLTTNRITTFDPAFKSRVHLALKYNALNAASRKELFVNFISRTSKNPPVFDDGILDRLAAVDINGRQIKNAVRTASALARDEGVPLSEEHLQSVLETIAEFEQDLSSKDEFSLS
ncbi:hypothetical protein OHC33_002282 [Knufia fluminis]|uniref:AAA+ ATPase domain-containing protein n=1 Tax=Knufia fluminis TaxID=191047 RepID=A0AAN8I819_9EURO|nr:hypothetical protein OHC33_002282 [Knufia fluminis]